MKYTALLNLAGIHDAGLSDKTDVVDWVIIEYIADWYTAPGVTRRDDKVWINYRHLIAELPLLGLKTKSAVSRRITNLSELGLLNIDHDDDGRVYAAISQSAKDTMSYSGTEANDRHDAKHIGSCTYCGITGVKLQRDHIIPRSRGGSDDPENLTPACRPCNMSKGTKLLSEWEGRAVNHG